MTDSLCWFGGSRDDLGGASLGAGCQCQRQSEHALLCGGVVKRMNDLLAQLGDVETQELGTAIVLEAYIKEMEENKVKHNQQYAKLTTFPRLDDAAARHTVHATDEMKTMTSCE